MASKLTPPTVEGLFVGCAILTSVVSVANPTFDICWLLCVVHNVVDSVGHLCRRLCHVFDYHLVVDEVQGFLQRRSGVLDEKGCLYFVCH